MDLLLQNSFSATELTGNSYVAGITGFTTLTGGDKYTDASRLIINYSYAMGKINCENESAGILTGYSRGRKSEHME